MANQGTAGYGIIVKFDTKTVGELTGVSHDGISVTPIDISSSADTDNYKDFLPGKKDPGILEVTCRHASNDTNAGDTSPLYWIGLGRKTLEITFPLGAGQATAPKYSTTAFCIGDALPSGEQDGATERKLRFKLCSKGTFTAGS